MLASSFCASRPRDATRRVSATELVCAAQQRLRRSSVAAVLYNLALKWSSSSRPSSRYCQQHLEEGRGGTSRGDASSAQLQLRRSSISSSQAASSTSRRDAAAPRGGTRAARSMSSVAAASAPSQHQLRRSISSRRRQCPATMSGRQGEKNIGQPLDGSSSSPSTDYCHFFGRDITQTFFVHNLSSERASA